MVAAMHPQAKFDPIPPDLDLHELVDQTQCFRWAQRITVEQMRSIGAQKFEELVQVFVIERGQPLVVEGWDAVLPKNLFSAEWLETNYDKKQENVRDINGGSEIPMTTGHYLRSMKQLTNQWTSANFRDERRQRLYMKDIDCPPEWHEQLKKVIHPSLFYLNDNVTAKRGGRRGSDDDIFADDKVKPASAGDLMSSLPEEMRAQNLMCYVGHEGTYTPAHREMCASLGQNIMVETSGNTNGEKPGSSVWFMTESKDRAVVREYFLSMLGHDIEIEKHFAQINAWKKAPFDVYVVEQKVGDFVLVPPLAAHQVWNRGTRTMKVAWNRTTVDTLELALHEALPKARLVCRDEQYKNKAIIFYTLEKYYGMLQDLNKSASLNFLGLGHGVNNDPATKQLAADFKRLVGLFGEVLVDEMFAVKEKEPEFVEFDSCITCSYCRSNIFNRFLTCKHCVRPLVDGSEDTYDVCMECYAMGRSCACLSGLQWCEQWKWSELVEKYETWRAMVIKNDGYIDVDTSPQPFEIARHRAGKRTVAEICQDALKRRPWKDILKPEREKTPSDSEPDAAEGKPKKKKNTRKTKHGKVQRCHVCCHSDYAYRVHTCTNPGCNEGYCYGTLYRAFDMMPQKVLADEHWQCPKCLGICNCGKCRRSGNTDPYTPKNTSLGHDTRPVADDRSIEALVDFRLHNLTWLKAAGEESRSKDSKRMKRLREQADNEKASQPLTTDEAPAQDADAPGKPATQGPNGGYGDPSHVVSEGQPMAAEYAQAASAQLEGDVRGEGDVSMVDATEVVDEGDESMYPDPTALATQRIGMGYYEQDDTEDRILFDPYQAPSPQTLAFDKADVSEYVKKVIRGIKRKQRKEDEDPEFKMSRSHAKKARAPKPDMLDTMDPALFSQPQDNSELTPEQILALTAATQLDESRDPATVQQGEVAPTATAPGATRYEANEPELRHAKPMASYTEPEDMDIDLIDQMINEANAARQLAGGLASPRRSPDPEGGGKSAADAASEAVRALLGGSTSTPSAAPRRPGRPSLGGSAAPSTGKRRGRPPKQPGMTVELPVASQSTSPVLEIIPKRRGRPRKSDMVPLPEPESEEDIPEPEEVEPAPVSLNRRGQPRRSGVTTINAPPPETDSDEVEESDVDVDKPKPRKRGRPRKSDAVPVRVASPSLGDTSFLSMKERMAMRGKSFKIRGSTRRSTAANSQTKTPEADDQAKNKTPDDEESNDGGDGASQHTSDRSPTPPRPRRTAAKEDDYVSSSSDSSIEAGPRGGSAAMKRGEVASDSDESMSDAGEVVRRTSSRGRGFRGRGRGRGRVRGRVA